tara:strand:+ start:59 stop:772 length:714 start_codon:yes stop_codon:yes gene_type:complete
MKHDKSSVLVFAGSGGLGLEICKKFLSENFHVYFTSQNKSKINKTLSLLKANDSDNVVKGLYCDASKEKNINRIIKNFFQQSSKKRIIVNCIGSFEYDGVKSLSLEKLSKTFIINTIPTILITKYISLYKSKNEKIKVFSIGSSSSYDGFDKTIAYCASKHALLGAIRSLNKELIKKNIYNLNINPGSIKTKMGKKVRNQKFSEFISPNTIANFIFDLSKLEEPAFVEDVFLRRLVK